jgi:hypothetical protein
VEEQVREVERVGIAAVALGLCTAGGGLTGVLPPVVARLPRPGHHRGHQHHQRHRPPRRDERRREPAQRLGHEHEPVAGTVADRGHDHLRVGVEVGRVVVAGQVDGHDLVAARRQSGNDEMPVPGVGAGAGDQHERGHGHTTISGGTVHRRMQRRRRPLSRWWGRK